MGCIYKVVLELKYWASIFLEDVWLDTDIGMGLQKVIAVLCVHTHTHTQMYTYICSTFPYYNLHKTQVQKRTINIHSNEYKQKHKRTDQKDIKIQKYKTEACRMCKGKGICSIVFANKKKKEEPLMYCHLQPVWLRVAYTTQGFALVWKGHEWVDISTLTKRGFEFWALIEKVSDQINF